jgi:D(-)-tartrate dehydratase
MTGGNPRQADAHRRRYGEDDRNFVECPERGLCLRGTTVRAIVVHTDSTKNGKPLGDLAFDSVSRDRHGGLLGERFISRLTAADPERYADRNEGISSRRVRSVVMQDEKPAGHGKRCGAAGLIDAAIWDLAAKAYGEPLWRTFAHDGLPRASRRIAIYPSGRLAAARICVLVRRGLSCDGSRSLPVQDQDRRRGVVQHLRRGRCSQSSNLARCSQMRPAVDGNGTFSRDVARSYLHQCWTLRGERCRQRRTIQ